MTAPSGAGSREDAPVISDEGFTIQVVTEADLPDLLRLMRAYCDFYKTAPPDAALLLLCRALLANPRIFLFDEPSEGLAPRLIDVVTETIAGLRERGLSAIVVEQNLHVAVGLADRVVIMTKGQIAYRATTQTFRSDRATAHALLGLG